MLRLTVTAALSAMIVTSLACSVEPAAEEEASRACDAASAHVSACLGMSVSSFDSCGEAEARSAADLLEMDCDQIDTTIDPGKADYWANGNPLCLFLTPVADQVLPGGLCCFDYNCQDDTVCRGYRCRAPGDEGDRCDRNNHCEEGLVCGIDDRCGAPSSRGDTCDDENQCERNLRCIDEMCAAPSNADGRCDEDGDCVLGLFCSDQSTCQPRAETGATCGDNNECSGGLRCIAGSCGPRSSAGGACDVGDAFDCAFGLTCVGGACVPDPVYGEPCEREPATMCGFDLTCWDGICQPKRDEGETCERLFDCRQPLFCNDGTCGPI